MNLHEIRGAAAKLISAAGLGGSFELYPIPGGANNRVFRVDVNGISALLKAYFRHPQDPRDRLGAEFAFSSFAWNEGITCVPRPLAADGALSLALYEFVPGRRLSPSEVDEARVLEALQFYLELNRVKGAEEALRLPVASEGCFSFSEHLHCVERRIQRLAAIRSSDALGAEAAMFVGRDLAAAWHRIRELAIKQISSMGIGHDEKLDPASRCLSPSDFGFHNALLSDGGSLRFFDFEYAGWDDPAKMVCDFFCQPQIPVPITCYDTFVEKAFGDIKTGSEQAARCSILLPVYRIKWCCILLNEFLPVDVERRRFANRGSSGEDRRHAQLVKARTSLENLLTYCFATIAAKFHLPGG